MALSVRPSSDLEFRQFVVADSDRHQRQRPRDQGGGLAEQAGVFVRARPCHWHAGVADRGAPGSTIGRPRRENGGDPANSDQATALQPQLLEGARRCDRLYAGVSCTSARGAEAIQGRRFAVYAADPRQLDRKSTRLNSSHGYISYAVFCLKKKKRRIDGGVHESYLATANGIGIR